MELFIHRLTIFKFLIELTGALVENSEVDDVLLLFNYLSV